MSRSYRSVFPIPAPVFAMLHLKGDDSAERLDRARREIDILWEHGVDAVVVENYFGGVEDVKAVLDYLDAQRPDVVVGLNVLRDDATAFALAAEHRVTFVQLDSVAGHLPPEEDKAFADRLHALRETVDAAVLGGVRFKYQPLLSGRTLEEDLGLAVERCDAVVVTGAGTGLVTPVGKIRDFRQILGPTFPLVVGAGVTAENAREQLDDADGVIVGSALKDTLTDTGDVSPEHVQRFVAAAHAAR
jgi:predicted TIM-barrel enzyme